MQVTEGKLIDYIYITTKADLAQAIAILSTKKLLACDTETYPDYITYGAKANWRDPHTSLIKLYQFNWESNRTPFIIDVLKIGVENLQSLIDLLLNPNIRKVFHNSNFDQKQTRKTLGIWIANCWCTLVMARRLNVCTGFRAGQMRGNSLKALARDYCGIDLSKVEQNSDWSNPNLTTDQLQYAALDVGSPKDYKHESILLYLYRLFEKTLYTPAPNGFGGKCKLKDYQEPIEIDQLANAILAKIEYTGMPVSKKMLDLIYNTASAEVEELKLYLCEALDLPKEQIVVFTNQGAQQKIILDPKTESTLNSPKQLVGLINKTLKNQIGTNLTDVQSSTLEDLLKQLKVKESNKTDKSEEAEEYFEDEESNLEEEEISFGIELVDKLLKYKELSKLISIDYRELINPVTGRLHSSYQCIGASTGRMSSGGKGSFNCQNISSKYILVKYLLSLDPYNSGVIPSADKEAWQNLTIRHAFVVDKPGMLFATSDFTRQEIKIAMALSSDPNGVAIETLDKEYELGIREKPRHPITNETYVDPKTDQHIIAGSALNPEVKQLMEEEPWNANKDNLLVGPWRQKGKILNYRLIYLGSAQSLAPELGVSIEEAQAFIDKYFSFPNGFYGLGEWLQSMAAIGTELRWVITLTGEHIYTCEDNSKGLGDKNTGGRKSVNSCIQGVASTQAKLALIKADVAFKELDKKYEHLLNGRKAEIIGIVHDEIDAVIPGGCTFELVPDQKLNEKYKTDCYYKPTTNFDKTNEEHLMALHYAQVLRESMEAAMQETFDIIESKVPPGAECKPSLYWQH
jgi:DNA polymerase I-like protein with 3'-5' exonuclease and polymerase domains